MEKYYAIIILTQLFVNCIVYGFIAAIITYFIPAISFWQAFWGIVIIRFLFRPNKQEK